MSKLKNIPEFDMLQFINRRAALIYVSVSMELQLQEYQKKNPSADVSEAQKRIEIVQNQTEFMARLERDWLTIRRVNADYVLANLQLMHQVETLKKEVEVLNKQLEPL